MLPYERRWIFLVALMVALATVLSANYFIRFQAIIQQPGDMIGAIAAVGLAAVLAGVFSCIAICLVDLLAGSGLMEILQGDEQVSIRWLYLAALGVILGAGVAMFTHLALLLLSTLVSL